MDATLGPWRATKSSYTDASTDTDPNSPTYESFECFSMRKRSEVCRDMRMGTKHVKSRAETYLPRYENEDQADYENRIKFASFYNFYNKAASSLLGKVFSKSPTLTDTVPEIIKTQCKDADLNGNDWTIVAEQYFSHAMDEGISWLLVDFHSKENPEVELTMEQERELGVRPYWVVIPQHRVLGVDYAKNGEVYTITMFRYWASERIRDGEFGHKYVNRVYVYEPNRIRIFEENPDSKNKDEKWFLYKDQPITLGLVPATPLNLNPTGAFEALPPLEDLAEMNIEHFQIRSDQRRALSVASFPLLGVFGAKIDSQPRIGPMQAFTFESEKANMKWIESQGAHLRAGALELDVLEDKIRNFALSFESPGMYATATAVNVDSTDAVAPIIRWAYRLRDAMAQVLYYHAKWLKLPDGGVVDVDTSFIKSILTIEALKILVEALKEGSITKEGFLSRLKEYGILSDRFDVKGEVDKLDEQAAKAAQEALALAAAKPDPSPSSPPDNSTPPSDTGSGQ